MFWFAYHQARFKNRIKDRDRGFEILISYLSNSLSFVHLGAFAIAHAGRSRVVLVLSDGSENSVTAGELGVRLAERLESSVTLLHVIDLELLRETARVSEDSEPEVQARIEAEAETYLDHP